MTDSDCTSDDLESDLESDPETDWENQDDEYWYDKIANINVPVDLANAESREYFKGVIGDLSDWEIQKFIPHVSAGEFRNFFPRELKTMAFYFWDALRYPNERAPEIQFKIKLTEKITFENFLESNIYKNANNFENTIFSDIIKRYFSPPQWTMSLLISRWIDMGSMFELLDARRAAQNLPSRTPHDSVRIAVFWEFLVGPLNNKLLDDCTDERQVMKNQFTLFEWLKSERNCKFEDNINWRFVLSDFTAIIKESLKNASNLDKIEQELYGQAYARWNHCIAWNANPLEWYKNQALKTVNFNSERLCVLDLKKQILHKHIKITDILNCSKFLAKIDTSPQKRIDILDVSGNKLKDADIPLITALAERVRAKWVNICHNDLQAVAVPPNWCSDPLHPAQQWAKVYYSTKPAEIKFDPTWSPCEIKMLDSMYKLEFNGYYIIKCMLEKIRLDNLVYNKLIAPNNEPNTFNSRCKIGIYCRSVDDHYIESPTIQDVAFLLLQNNEIGEYACLNLQGSNLASDEFLYISLLCRKMRVKIVQMGFFNGYKMHDNFFQALSDIAAMPHIEYIYFNRLSGNVIKEIAIRIPLHKFVFFHLNFDRPYVSSQIKEVAGLTDEQITTLKNTSKEYDAHMTKYYKVWDDADRQVMDVLGLAKDHVNGTNYYPSKISMDEINANPIYQEIFKMSVENNSIF